MVRQSEIDRIFFLSVLFFLNYGSIITHLQTSKIQNKYTYSFIIYYNYYFLSRQIKIFSLEFQHPALRNEQTEKQKDIVDLKSTMNEINRNFKLKRHRLNLRRMENNFNWKSLVYQLQNNRTLSNQVSQRQRNYFLYSPKYRMNECITSLFLIYLYPLLFIQAVLSFC